MRRFTRLDLRGVVGKIAFDRDGQRRDVEIGILDMSLGGLLASCPRGTPTPHVDAPIVISVRLQKEWTPPLLCHVARVFTGPDGTSRIGVRFSETGRDDDAVARCALLSVAVLKTSTVTRLGDELRRCSSLIANTSIGHSELMTALGRYPRLPEHLIRLASSSLYIGRKVADVTHAVRVLGFQTAVNASLVFVLSQMVPPSDGVDRALWVRALAGAHLADRARKGMGEEARARIGEPFASTLLRDLGHLVLRRTFPLEVARLDERHDFCGSPCELEQAVFGVTHEQVNGMLCHVASIPDDIGQAMTAHHRLRPDASPLAALVHVVDAVVEQRPAIHDTAIRVLGIAGRDVEALRELLPEMTLVASTWYDALIAPEAHVADHDSGVFAKTEAASPPPSEAAPIPPTPAGSVEAEGAQQRDEREQRDHEEQEDEADTAAKSGRDTATDAMIAAFRAMAPHLAHTQPTRTPLDSQGARAYAERVLQAWTRAQPYLAAAAHTLPEALLARALRTGALALATRMASAIEALEHADTTRFASVALEMCEDLACAAAPLARRGLVDAQDLARARSAMKDDAASALAILAALFESSWRRIDGFTVVRHEEIERARAVAAELRATREAAAFVEEALAIDRVLDRCVAALDVAYDECRRVLTFVRWAERDADAIAPPLLVRPA